jgi:hypothetical protein
MCRIILLSVACPVIPHFSKLSHKMAKVTEHKMRVLIFSTAFSETLLIIRRILGDIIINLHTDVFT